MLTWATCHRHLLNANMRRLSPGHGCRDKRPLLCPPVLTVNICSLNIKRPSLAVASISFHPGRFPLQVFSRASFSSGSCDE